MGELVRLILLNLAENGLFMENAHGCFGKLTVTGSYTTLLVSLAEKDDTQSDFANLKIVITELGK